MQQKPYTHRWTLVSGSDPIHGGDRCWVCEGPVRCGVEALWRLGFCRSALCNPGARTVGSLPGSGSGSGGRPTSGAIYTSIYTTQKTLTNDRKKNLQTHFSISTMILEGQDGLVANRLFDSPEKRVWVWSPMSTVYSCRPPWVRCNYPHLLFPCCVDESVC